eukprot:TRINITY_DN5151_c0_g1_i1.p1 TRINITY_DN5151_c0_g1~~TRINITY_DN5151_c0_g1_i1.p1  ORF type:complete len:331 (+),score=57.83 TRINITY_DN5151_c0_g1_i1:205-1197(+)
MAASLSGKAAQYLGLIAQVMPMWKPTEVHFSQIACALSNTVYCVSRSESSNEKLLLRIYGSAEHNLFQREDEVEQACFLSSRGFGPQVLHTFETGRIESWIHGRTPSHTEMRSPEVMKRVAQKLRSLHDKTGLNHNDLHHNNMMITPDGDVEFLDFEYSSAADPTYDIANHFNEWTYPYDGTNPHLFNLGLYPCLAQRRDFIHHYLGGKGAQGALVDSFASEVEKRTQDSHAYWIEWAKRTPSEFNDKFAAARSTLLRDSKIASPSEVIQPAARHVVLENTFAATAATAAHTWGSSTAASAAQTFGTATSVVQSLETFVKVPKAVEYASL